MLYFGTAIRFALAVFSLALIGDIIPGFGHLTFGDAVLAAFVIAVLGHGIQLLVAARHSNYVCGVVGFVVAGIAIWVGQSTWHHGQVSVIAALFAAAVIGLINYGIPNSSLRS